MKNGLGVAQSIVLFGGTSDIGQAIVSDLLRPGVAHVVLVSRNIEEADRFGQDITQRYPDIDVHHVRFDGQDAVAMTRVVQEVVSLVADIDVVIVAQALLGDGIDFLQNPHEAIPLATVNFTATMTLLLALGHQVNQQGYGRIVLLSSVAGERVRRSNAVYGATKAGIDAFALALDHELSSGGGSILVVRPGFVTSKMTTGMQKAPFSATPATVAKSVARAIDSNARIIWTPSILRWVFMVFRHLPTALWRRMPF